MTEPDVALTDYAVALEGVVLFILLRTGARHQGRLLSWFGLYFASVSAACAFGGTVHGVFVDERSHGYGILWPLTLLAVGVTTSSTWAIASDLLLSGRLSRWVFVCAGVQ